MILNFAKLKKVTSFVRETRISRHNGETREGLSLIPQYDRAVIVLGTFSSNDAPHDAERRQSLGQLYV